MEAAFDGIAQDKHRRGGAVVGSLAAILGHAAAKFTEGQDRDAIGGFLTAKIREKSARCWR